MTSVAPSTYSYGVSTYGDLGDYGKGGGGDYAQTKSGSASIHYGVYSDPDNYSYDVSASSITIYKKDGSVWKTLSPSSPEWDTVITNLSADNASGKLRSGKATPQVKAPSAPSGGSGYSTDPGAGADTGAGEEPFYKKTWFPIAVVGGVATIALLTYALWPSKS